MSCLQMAQRIAGISYLGDFRMTFGENPKKVRNIVEGNFTEFRALYERKLQVIGVFMAVVLACVCCL